MPIYFQLTNQTLPISLESIGNQWIQSTINRPHGYPYYHWLQTENGVGDISIKGKQIRLKKGEGILIAPFTAHSYFPVEKWTTNFATFHGELNDSFDQLLRVNQYIVAKDNAHFSFSNAIDEIIALHIDKSLEANDLSLKCYNFLLNLRQGATQQLHHLPQQVLRYLEPVIQEIETNYPDIENIELLCDKLYISPQYLNRLFKQYLSKNPYQYLTEFRINKGKELLVNHPELKIQDIAHKIGFQSPSQFIAIFKAKVGLTPKKYRKLHL